MTMFPKGETRKRRKGRERRHERTVIGGVRTEVVNRDGFCRFYYMSTELRAECWAIVGPCKGMSQWSHYNATHRRSKTVHQAPEDRHDARFSLMLCAFHSAEYDQNRLHIETLTDRDCNGPIKAERDGKTWVEQE